MPNSGFQIDMDDLPSPSSQLSNTSPLQEMLSNPISVSNVEISDDYPPKLNLNAASTPSAASNNRVLKPRPPLECDYDQSPTDLYKLLEKSEWNTVTERLEDESEVDFRQQASVWVIRKEPNGKLRWRLLPLHAAIIFGAPSAVIEAVLEACPDAASLKDDQGMLPLHLALRVEHAFNWSVIEELLTANPGAVVLRDRKGRTPVAGGLLKTANQSALSVLQLYSSIIAASAKKQAKQEADVAHEYQISTLHQQHASTLCELKDAFYKDRGELVDKYETELRELRAENERLSLQVQQQQKALPPKDNSIVTQYRRSLVDRQTQLDAEKEAFESFLGEKANQGSNGSLSLSHGSVGVRSYSSEGVLADTSQRSLVDILEN